MTPDPFGIVGRIVDGRYRVEGVAGQGGFGVVYRARHLGFESPIALKVLKLPEAWSFARKQARVASFQREGRMLFELSALHPAIVRAFETGTIGSPDGSPAPYLALEWLDGASLDHEAKLRRKRGLAPMTLFEVLELLQGPAEGLARAHARGVVHRDVKPGNLFASLKDGALDVKILDFGIAKIVDETADTTEQYAATASATASFTAMYAAPEQWLERLGATGTWTDVHALALVCVELLSGNIPFAGREAAQFMAACLDPSVRPTPKSRGVELAAEVESVFARAVALEPRERFRDVGAFWRALSEAARWSPERVERSVELVSLREKVKVAVNAAEGQPASKRADAALVSSPSTTAATASLASRHTPVSSNSSSSKWLRLAAVGVAITAAGAYFVANVDGTSASAESPAPVPLPADTRIVSRNEVDTSPPAPPAGVSSSSLPAAPEPPSGSPAPSVRASRNEPQARANAAPNSPRTVPAPQSRPVSDGTVATDMPAPAPPVAGAQSSRAATETPHEGPTHGVNYDDPALTRRR